MSEEIWRVLYTVSRYLFPFFAVLSVLFILFYILSESRTRKERLRGLPGAGNIGELIVLSGSRGLDTNTWFPVPREGVLGSVRSCDLVIPCPGVSARHLDFSWVDGTGLLIRPRTGCEVRVNDTLLTCRTDVRAVPMAHGSILQVGSAVLRLHLFAALDPSGPRDSAAAPIKSVEQDPFVPAFPPVPAEPFQQVPGSYPPPPQQVAVYPYASSPVPPSSDLTEQNPEESSCAPAVPKMRPHRSDLWKEDLGE